MQSDQPASPNGRSLRSSDDLVLLSELEGLRTTCRRQALVIERLTEAASTFQRGARALKAENAELRAESDRLRVHRSDRPEDGRRVEEAVALGTQAPRIARGIVAHALADRVDASVLENAQLVVSELITNSVRHSGVADGEDLVVRLHLWRGACRLEVEDPGHDGVIAAQPPDMLNGAGVGLHLVQMLSERWGVVRAAKGPTRVWAQLACPGSATGGRRAA
jgi:serine/threonine-protein kinase RsbW